MNSTVHFLLLYHEIDLSTTALSNVKPFVHVHVKIWLLHDVNSAKYTDPFHASIQHFRVLRWLCEADSFNKERSLSAVKAIGM